jgi:[protein-PII] uridylyltransferase
MGFPAREALLADRTINGAPLCRALAHATDGWLGGLFVDAVSATGFNGPAALVAVGGYGRGELAPWSDLDVLLLHDTKRGIETIAQGLWYPIWDTKLKLGHAVRTVKEASRLAADDLDTATSLLEVRHIAGEPALTKALHDQSVAAWRKRSRTWLKELADRVDQRHEAAGEVAFLLEPNLKDGRGGLRDVHSLRWAEAAEMVLLEGDDEALQAAYDVLLGARVELHRLAARPGDVLALQDQDAVAANLGYRSADTLMAALSGAARSIAWTSDEAWRRVRSTLSGPSGREFRRDHPVASGVVVRDREIHLDGSASPADDPTLVLRVAAAAARHRTTIERRSLDRLAAEMTPWPNPWPTGASDDLVALLLEGHAAIPVLESLDQRGLLVKILPEWKTVRSKPQRNAYHRYTVDRHLWETAANAAALANAVSRPDLLVLGALLHDIGKGVPGDHTQSGMTLVEGIGHRMGLPEADTEVLVAMVEHHLLLPDAATRRDLSDDATIQAVADAAGTAVVLELLDSLTQADSLATGPSAWSPWKAELVAELVSKAGHVVKGGSAADVTWSLFPTAEVLALMGTGRTEIVAAGDRIVTVAPDRPGLFSRVAGVLSLHGLDVLGAQAHSDEQGMAANEFRVADSPHGVPWERVVVDLERALQGRLAIEARLAERARTYRRRSGRSASPAVPHVLVDNTASSNATVLEVRAPDRVGVLHRITKALADMQLDIRHARVQTLGHEVVDTFYVRDASGSKVVDPFHVKEIERAVLFSVSE